MSFEPSLTHLAQGCERNMRSLFDCALSLDLIERVLHFRSHRPRHVFSLCYVRPRDVLALFGSSEELRAAALRTFRSVRVTSLNAPYEFCNPGYTLSKEPNMLLIQHDAPSAILPPLLDVLGCAMSKLNARELTLIGIPRMQSWAEVLVREARPISELHLCI